MAVATRVSFWENLSHHHGLFLGNTKDCSAIGQGLLREVTIKRSPHYNIQSVCGYIIFDVLLKREIGRVFLEHEKDVFVITNIQIAKPFDSNVIIVANLIYRIVLLEHFVTGKTALPIGYFVLDSRFRTPLFEGFRPLELMNQEMSLNGQLRILCDEYNGACVENAMTLEGGGVNPETGKKSTKVGIHRPKAGHELVTPSPAPTLSPPVATSVHPKPEGDTNPMSSALQAAFGALGSGTG